MGIEINVQATFGDITKTINLSQPTGGDNSWYVYIGNRFQGVLINRKGEWKHYSNKPTEFTVDDIQIMGEMIDAELAKK